MCYKKTTINNKCLIHWRGLILDNLRISSVLNSLGYDCALLPISQAGIYLFMQYFLTKYNTDLETFL